jgi:hypothetical protein
MSSKEFKEEPELYQIPLSDGSVMEIQATSLFFEKIREQFNLSTFQAVTDVHIRKFIWKNCNEAFDKYEKDEDNGR